MPATLAKHLAFLCVLGGLSVTESLQILPSGSAVVCHSVASVPAHVHGSHYYDQCRQAFLQRGIYAHHS